MKEKPKLIIQSLIKELSPRINKLIIDYKKIKKFMSKILNYLDNDTTSCKKKKQFDKFVKHNSNQQSFPLKIP